MDPLLAVPGQQVDGSWRVDRVLGTGATARFSLAGISERDITAGTRGYLDPFLGTDRRPVFDDHAERYAAAVTLHEMASNEKPVWGDGMTDPRTTTDQTPTLSVELFELALREGLTAFFQRALKTSDQDAASHAALRGAGTAGGGKC